jgi:hypothetical protein
MPRQSYGDRRRPPGGTGQGQAPVHGLDALAQAGETAAGDDAGAVSLCQPR